jgi:hypothetical protein
MCWERRGLLDKKRETEEGRQRRARRSTNYVKLIDTSIRRVPNENDPNLNETEISLSGTHVLRRC